MSRSKYVLAIDQGTTGTTVVLFNGRGEMVRKIYQEFRQYYPRPGWVEHDAWEIWSGVQHLLQRMMGETAISPRDLAAIGITNQRETVVLWDRLTGRPVTKAIVWQCRRTAQTCEQLRKEGLEPLFKEKTGLVLDPYFSGTKLKWIFDHYPDLRARAERGELVFGTIDSWLIYNLTGQNVHVTDYTNASRTLLFNLKELDWDSELLQILDIPHQILPQVRPSNVKYGYTRAVGKIPGGIPVAGAAGDQQAALFGQACFEPGTVKATFGTGAFILMNTGRKPVFSQNGLLTTVAWGLDERVEYALEGSVFIAGAAVQWLRDEMGLIKEASETEAIAQSVADTNGVCFVPSFVGLGAPHWDPYARGMITGLTRGATKAHVIRAALEAIVYQTREILDVMETDAQIPLHELKVDGGASENEFICQFLADLTERMVERPCIFETTALGAAYLAGLAVGIWDSQAQIEANRQVERIYQSKMDASRRIELYQQWNRAVQSVKSWVSHA